MTETEYDIIIIGAGLGGLLSAALLSKEGYKVCVLEKNKQIGGCLQSYGLDKKLVESAVHYIGSLGEGQTLYKVFNYLGLIGKLKLSRLDIDCFDKIILDDKEYSMAQGHDNFIEKLTESFPKEKAGIKNYVHEVQRICSNFPLYNMRIGSEEEKNSIRHFGLKEKMDSFTNNEILKQVLCGNNLLYAGQYETTPFYLHALIENSYIESSWKCKNGSTQIAKLLKTVILENGGHVLRNVEIIKLKETDGLLKYVQDYHGEKYFAKYFISNLHPQLTFRMIESNLIRPVTIKRVDALKNTMSSFIVNVSVKEKMIPFLNHNIYFHKTNDVWKDVHEEITHSPSSFGIFFTEDKDNPGFASAISILTYLNAKATQRWADTFHTTSKRIVRNQEYVNFKQHYIQTILHSVQAVIPSILEATKTTDACTPLTFRDYLKSPDGTMYGIQKNVHTLSSSTIATRTKIPNLSLTGQNINIHGVLGVSITSVLNAADFVGLEYLLDKINRIS